MEEFKKHSIDFQKALEGMTESVLVTSTELQRPGPFILYVNPAFEKMTGWKKEEVIGKTPRLLQGENTDMSIFRNFREILETGGIWEGQTINYRKDGSEFVMQWSITPIRNEENVIHQYLAVQKDVTQKVLMEEKLEQARKTELMRYEQIDKMNAELRRLNETQKRTLNLFHKYVPEPIVRDILHGDGDTVFNGEQLEIAALFCDIRNFTSISEKLNPREVVFLLQTYYSCMSEVIQKFQGHIVQFVGDEIFVAFGAPVAISDCEALSVYCAKAMIEKMDDINKRLIEKIGVEIQVGIGINSGPVIAGNLGSDNKLSYSITGDTVNTAKRIESLTREHPGTILISDTIYKQTKKLVKTKNWGDVDIKGKDERVKVYQVIDS